MLYNYLTMNIGFILGRESELSKAEIYAFLSRENIDFQTVFDSKDVLILEVEKGLKLSINELGGTIKLFRVLGDKVAKQDVKKFIQNNFEIEQIEKRVNFGISGYGRIESNTIYAIGKTIKNELLAGGLKARFVIGKYKDLTSVIVTENKLLERGFEAILVENHGSFYVGKTIEVQNYKAYSKRDYGRTSRDDKSGMLPPKLAQIMINLAQTPKEKVLYDPFCGSGTILQEAILLGYSNIYGSDISEKAIADTKENLRWLISGLQELITETKKNEILKQVQDNVFVSDVLNPTTTIKADAIVCEGYLGEPIRRNVAEATVDATKMTDFYLRALANLEKNLNKNGTIVIALPFYIIGKEKVFLQLEEKIGLTGLKIIKQKSIRGTYTYSRPESFVGREIFILKRS